MIRGVTPISGIEGISYDPLTSGFIAVKEKDPEGIFQTGIDFDLGTATNGSPTTVNSINLFAPALANLLDFADVFALSNMPFLSGQADYDNLLVLSQESGKIVNIDRAGNILSTLTLEQGTDVLPIPDQGHEGVTMDRDGNLYFVSEQGGGSDIPQLRVYEPASAPNQAPTAIELVNHFPDLGYVKRIRYTHGLSRDTWDFAVEASQLASVRLSAQRGRPLGDEAWVDSTARRSGEWVDVADRRLTQAQ